MEGGIRKTCQNPFSIDVDIEMLTQNLPAQLTDYLAIAPWLPVISNENHKLNHTQWRTGGGVPRRHNGENGRWLQTVLSCKLYVLMCCDAGN